MYTPKLSDQTVCALFRAKEALNIPMTKLADKLIVSGLRAMNKHAICSKCCAEGNKDCSECILVQADVKQISA